MFSGVFGENVNLAVAQRVVDSIRFILGLFEVFPVFFGLLGLGKLGG